VTPRIFDVDGVMTDGTLWFGPRGEALKAVQHPRRASA
jgi:3-deoxy-D-manno-octulosonate 8-phosphate phosphatase KdsC-like HAD superfamily phosphatase